MKEASSDKRFYGKYDRVTGYTTKSILAVPVLNQYGKTIGVLEAINKNTKEGHFTSQDQQLLVSISSTLVLLYRHYKENTRSMMI